MWPSWCTREKMTSFATGWVRAAPACPPACPPNWLQLPAWRVVGWWVGLLQCLASQSARRHIALEAELVPRLGSGATRSTGVTSGVSSCLPAGRCLGAMLRALCAEPARASPWLPVLLGCAGNKQWIDGLIWSRQAAWARCAACCLLDSSPGQVARPDAARMLPPRLEAACPCSPAQFTCSGLDPACGMPQAVDWWD